MKQQKSILFDKLIPFFVQSTKFLNIISNYQSVETIIFSNCNWRKNGKCSSSLQQGRQGIRTFFIFDNTAPFSAPFRKFTSIRITIGSGLKRVATGSVSTRYQTTLFAQPLKSENFDLICPIFNIQNLQAKSLDLE